MLRQLQICAKNVLTMASITVQIVSIHQAIVVNLLRIAQGLEVVQMILLIDSNNLCFAQMKNLV